MFASSSTNAIDHRRVLALVGPYGSGKTELAIALAAAAAGRGQRAVLADLDVLKPYFRSREASLRSARAGVRTLAPPDALAMADLPIVPAELRAALLDRGQTVVVDVGGDAAGARVLASVADALPPDQTDVWLVLNHHRPFVQTVPRAVALARAIAAACGVALTGVVSNSHLLDSTAEAMVREGLTFAEQVAAELGVAVVAVMAPVELWPALQGQLARPPLVPVARAMALQSAGGVVNAHGGCA